MTRRSAKRRPKRLAAAVVAGGLMLVPAALATTSGRYVLPASASLADGAGLPDAGDLLAAVRRAQGKPEDYGASGKLPEADTLSPELIAALAGPAPGSGPTILDTGAGPLASVPPGPLGIPGVMLDAYLRAERSLAASHPSCGVHWSVLAAIGRIESSHARGGAVDAQGNTVRPILGPQLSGGPGIAAIRDSDGGALDGDQVWDRAVGPMQFIPTTWAGYAADGNNDGTANPHNIYDATVAAGRYLCAGGGDLRNATTLAQAVFRYNHSESYVANVLSWAAAYASGVTPLPSSPTPIGPDGDQPPLAAPPVTVPPGTTPPTSSTAPTTTTSSSSTTTTTTTTQPTTTTTSPTCPTEPTSTTTTTSPTTTPPPSCETTTTTPPPTDPSTVTTPPTSTAGQSTESSTAQSTVDATSSVLSSTVASSPDTGSTTTEAQTTTAATGETATAGDTSATSADAVETTTPMPTA